MVAYAPSSVAIDPTISAIKEIGFGGEGDFGGESLEDGDGVGEAELLDGGACGFCGFAVGFDGVYFAGAGLGGGDGEECERSRADVQHNLFGGGDVVR